MSGKRLMVVMGLLVSVGAGALFISDQRLKALKREREAHFLTLLSMAEYGAEENGAEENVLENVLKSSGGNDYRFLKPFPDGIVYKTNGKSFTLEEPGTRFVSLLKKDRLIATDRKWPRWESSGEYARKFPGQEVPGKGYE